MKLQKSVSEKIFRARWGGFIIAFPVLWIISKSRTFQFFGAIYPRVETGKKAIALTFDDGPTPKTDRILAILDGLIIKATFFVAAKLS